MIENLYFDIQFFGSKGTTITQESTNTPDPTTKEWTDYYFNNIAKPNMQYFAKNYLPEYANTSNYYGVGGPGGPPVGSNWTPTNEQIEGKYQSL